ncbi:serine hydrolase [Bacillus infantis]|uniref:serine hydrolase n=1 Tax=Bacillus infantis TaxID=324767 RepID=UPI003CFB2B9C
MKKLFLFFSIIFLIAGSLDSDASASQKQSIQSSLGTNLDAYIKTQRGSIAVHYYDLESGEQYGYNSKKAYKAASTIKLPLALYVMELADQGKLKLSDKLVYRSYHYYGGSGITQKDKIGSSYTIQELLRRAMVYSDNIAFIMLREKVGRLNFTSYIKSIGGTYAYPGGQNLTSAYDLALYSKRLYEFSKKSSNGKLLVEYLKNTVYNTTIPAGIKNTPIAHKVGMIPMDLIYNDAAIVFADKPYALAVTTSGINYQHSQQVIAKIAAIVHQEHLLYNSKDYIKVLKPASVVDNSTGKLVEIGVLSAGQVFEIQGMMGNWYKIDFGTKTGFVHKSSAQFLDTAKLAAVPASNTTRPVRTLGKATVYDNSSGKLVPFAAIEKNTVVTAIRNLGNWKGIMIGGRIGYAASSAVKELFLPEDQSFAIANDDIAVYENSGGKLIQIGTLKAGESFKRNADYGNWHMFDFAGKRAFVWKDATIPQKGKYAKQQTVLGTAAITESVIVYDNSTGKLVPIGAIEAGTSVQYVHELENWYEILIGGRKGYILKQK